jgi:hypothetical protein
LFDDKVLVPPHLVVQVPVYQGHRVPEHAYYPRFGFDSDTPMPLEAVPAEEDVPGATAQNGMVEVKFYQCSNCQMIVRENDIPDHQCEAGDGT